MIRSRQVFAPKAKTRARKAQLARCWLVGGALFVLQTFAFDIAQSQELKVNTLKQITFHKLNYNFEQFYCLDEIVWKESRWNYKAKNGSHYGLGQMRNPMVKTLNPKEQIVLHLKYVGHRYGFVNDEPNACRAAEHFDSKGWH